MQSACICSLQAWPRNRPVTTFFKNQGSPRRVQKSRICDAARKPSDSFGDPGKLENEHGQQAYKHESTPARDRESTKARTNEGTNARALASTNALTNSRPHERSGERPHERTIERRNERHERPNERMSRERTNDGAHERTHARTHARTNAPCCRDCEGDRGPTRLRANRRCVHLLNKSAVARSLLVPRSVWQLPRMLEGAQPIEDLVAALVLTAGAVGLRLRLLDLHLADGEVQPAWQIDVCSPGRLWPQPRSGHPADSSNIAVKLKRLSPLRPELLLKIPSRELLVCCTILVGRLPLEVLQNLSRNYAQNRRARWPRHPCEMTVWLSLWLAQRRCGGHPTIVARRHDARRGARQEFRSASFVLKWHGGDSGTTGRHQCTHRSRVVACLACFAGYIKL